MDDKWKTLLIALILAIIMAVCALIQQYWAFGDEVFEGIFSPIGLLTWGGGFIIALIFWYIIIDLIKKRKGKK